MTITKKSIISLLLIIYLFVTVFFPVDQYNVRIITLGLATLISFNSIFSQKKQMNFTLFFCIIFSLVTTVISIVLTGNITNSIRSGYIPLLFLWFPIIIDNDIDYKKYFFCFLKIEAIVLLMLFLLDMLGLMDINFNFIKDFIYQWKIGFVGKSPDYAFYYKIFFKTSPLLVFLVDKMIDEKNVPMTLIACIGLIVSGTRANVIILLAYLSYRFFFYNKKKSKIKVLLSVLFIAVIVFNFPTIIDAFTDIMNKKGSLKSDAIRGGLMNSYKSIFSNVKILLFGMGYSAAFYNYGTQSYAIAGEYSYLELIRQVGIICFALFMMFIIYPLISKIDNSKKFVYIGYLIIAYTNPLLFSSTAFAAYIYMYILVYEKNICTKDNNRGDKLNEKNSVCV